MNYLYAILVISLIVFLYFVLRYSYINTSSVKTGLNERYNVHREHHNPEQAAALLKEIVDRNKIFVEHLSAKYNLSNLSTMNPEKEGRIDIIPASSAEDDIIASNMPFLMNDVNYLTQRVMQLRERYKVHAISEISPLNPSGSTSYTENKGEKLVLCLRNKTPNANGEYEFHEINLLVFVCLHEITHIMNDRWGHKMQFWQLFKFVLKNAVEAGIYEPVDYSKNPVTYCGMKISYSPFYDSQMEGMVNKMREDFHIH